jgi:hypothetical protein
MPEATSPIIEEILPRPKSSSTTTATMIMPQIPGACMYSIPPKTSGFTERQK